MVGPIQDVAPPPADNSGSLSGPELVHDIPVKQPAGGAFSAEADLPPSFMTEDSKTKLPKVNFPDVGLSSHVDGAIAHKKPRPVLAQVILAAAILCALAGAYLKFKS